MDEIKLAYDDTGAGSPPFVLLHGAFGRKRDYRNQVAYFGTDHRVIAIDLRGHGDSPKPEEGYTIAQFADDVAAVCSSAGVRGANVVGHSMGGVIAVELGSRYPDLVRAIATLDSPSIIPGWHEAHAGLYDEAMKGPDYREVLRGFLAVASSATDDPERSQESAASIDGMPRHSIIGTWGAIGTWDPQPALERLDVPLLYLDHGQPDLDYDLLRTHAPRTITGQTVGAGHRALLEVPDQVNGMLDRFFLNADVLTDEAAVSSGSYRYQTS